MKNTLFFIYSTSILVRLLTVNIYKRTVINSQVIVTFNKQQLSELFNRDHFESLLNRIFLLQKSENARLHSSNSIKNATPL